MTDATRGDGVSQAPATGHAGPLLSARCTECRQVTTKRTSQVVGDLSNGSFKHACHNCQLVTWWNVLRIIDESHPHAGRGST